MAPFKLVDFQFGFCHSPSLQLYSQLVIHYYYHLFIYLKLKIFGEISEMLNLYLKL